MRPTTSARIGPPKPSVSHACIMGVPMLLCTLSRVHGSILCVGAPPPAAHYVGGGDDNLFRRLMTCAATAKKLERGAG